MVALYIPLGEDPIVENPGRRGNVGTSKCSGLPTPALKATKISDLEMRPFTASIGYKRFNPEGIWTEITMGNKLSFFKRHKWLVAIAAVLLAAFLVLATIGAFEINGDNAQNGIKPEKGEPTGRFSDAQLQQANLTLSQGIRIEDPANDFYQFPENSFQPDGRPDNPHPYPLPYTDLRSLTVGADQDYLYCKFQFWGQFPDGPAIYNGDVLNAVGGKIESFTFTNGEGKEDSAELGDGVGFVEHRKDGTTVPAEHPTIGQLAMLTPTGQDEKLETLYKTMTGAGMVYGGPGYDYVLGAYPLRIFGIKLGDVVTFASSTETSSAIYHHEVVDFLLGQEGSKFGATIKYKLGANAYEVLPYRGDFEKPNVAEQGEPTLITPYVNAFDVTTINEAFSTSANAPWGFAHNGIDFFPTGDNKPFRAVCSGKVVNAKLWWGDENSNWQVNVFIEFNSSFSVGYAFEPFSKVEADGQTQLGYMLVTEGQKVSQGDIIGNLHTVGGGAHVHFGLIKNGKWISPEPYFTPDAENSVLEIFHRTFPGANLSYP